MTVRQLTPVGETVATALPAAARSLLVSDTPTDAEIEARLTAATSEQWEALDAAVRAISSESELATWSRMEQAGTTTVDGVERPVYRMPYVHYAPAVDRLLGCMAAVGASLVFDWMAWDGAERLRGPTALAAAPVADAVRMVTAIRRAERFAEGSIAATLEDGTLLAAAHRLLTWHTGRRDATP